MKKLMLFLMIMLMSVTTSASAATKGGKNQVEKVLPTNIIVKQTTLPSGVSRTDTLSCTLADEDGNILGKGVNYYQHVFPLTNISLSEGESVVIAIRHNMIRETLPGIADVGIRLSKL